MRKVTILSSAAVILMAVFVCAGDLLAETTFEKTFDSLFVIASSGEVRFRDQNGPAMDSIAAYGVEAVPLLIDKFTTKSARERWTVLWTLQRIGKPAVPDLILALERPDWLVVSRVAWALGDIKDSSAVEPLKRLAENSDWHVRDEVVTALGKIGDSRANDAVAAAFADSVGQVRKSAAVSAAQLRMEPVIPELVHQLGDDFYGARMTAAETLAKLDTATTVKVLIDSVNSPNRFVGDIGCQLLGRLGTPDAEQTLLEQAGGADPERRAHAAVALIRNDPQDNCGYRKYLLERETDRLTRLKIESAISQYSQ